MTDDFFIAKTGKNKEKLKQYIKNNLVIKQGAQFQAKNEETKEELRKIQRICLETTPQIHPLSEHTLFEEIKTCVNDLCSSINYQFDKNQLNKSRSNIIICFLELIQNCNIVLHDGKKGKGYLTVGINNTLYQQDKKIENMNISFSAEIPVEQSFVIFEVVQTGVLIKKHIPNPDSVIIWQNRDRTYGKLTAFELSSKNCN